MAGAQPRARSTRSPSPTGRGRESSTDVDPRVIESENYFEGQRVTKAELLHPRHWHKLTNVFRPSWGEPYEHVAQRMLAAIADARTAAYGHEAVIVSHQLPVWTVRNKLAGAHLWHDPRRRECALASLTSLLYEGDELASITYSEPAAELVARASKSVGA